MSDDPYRPVEQLLGGLTFAPMPQGHMAVGAIVLVKGIDLEGRIGWYTRYTEDLTSVECLGALRAGMLLEEDRVRDAYRPDGDD